MVEMKFYARSSGHDEVLNITRIESGWNVKFQSIDQNCNQMGDDTLKACFDLVGVNYPADLGEYMLVAHETTNYIGTAFDVKLHETLKLLGAWITKVEMSTPSQAPFRMLR